MVPWVRTVTGGGREEQMQEQDEVLLASATMWDLNCPVAVACPRLEAYSLTGIAYPNTVSSACSISWQQTRLTVQREPERYS